MVNNYKTCNYYYTKGVKYALLGKEITLEEILEIIKLSSITSMVEVVGLPSVAFSKRKLITNYFKDLNKEPKDKLVVREKVSDADYELQEDFNGTSFFLKDVVNGTVLPSSITRHSTFDVIWLASTSKSSDVYGSAL